MDTGAKRRRADRGGTSSEIAEIITRVIQVSEECDAKRRVLEAELEEKRREQERKHEENVLRMMMGFMQQQLTNNNQTLHTHSSFPPASLPFPSTSTLNHSPFFHPNSFADSEDRN